MTQWKFQTSKIETRLDMSRIMLISWIIIVKLRRREQIIEKLNDDLKMLNNEQKDKEKEVRH